MLLGFVLFFNENHKLVIILVNNVLYVYVFVSSGQDIQGTSVVANLPVLMRQNPAETLRRVLPKIRVSFVYWGLNVTFSPSLRTVPKEKQYPTFNASSASRRCMSSWSSALIHWSYKVLQVLQFFKNCYNTEKKAELILLKCSKDLPVFWQLFENFFWGSHIQS